MKKLILIASGLSLGLVMVMMFAFNNPATAQTFNKTKFGLIKCEGGQIITVCTWGAGGCMSSQYCPE